MYLMLIQILTTDRCFLFRYYGNPSRQAERPGLGTAIEILCAGDTLGV
jgi:hypothetical protein